MSGILSIRSIRLLSVAGLVGLGLVVGGGSASAGGANTVKVTGPTSNALGQPFIEKISGHASGKADYLVAWEQGQKRKGCASTYAAESARTFQSSKYSLGMAANKKVKGSYGAAVHFTANAPGAHVLCAYLIGLSNGKTYAHASRSWINHQ